MDWIKRVGRPLRPRDLHVFLAVAECGSMVKAAERLACSRPVVSKSITALEGVLGVTLFDRTARGVEPTRYGEALLRRGLNVFDELRQTVNEIAQLLDPNAGDLRIGCLEPMMAGLASAAVDRLLQKLPRLHLHMLTGNAPAQLQWLRERKCELILARTVDNELDSMVEIEELYFERLLVVANAESRLARRAKLSLAELTNEQWILSSHEIQPGGPASEAFARAGVPLPDVRIQSDSLALRYSLLATGRFLTMIPASVFLFGPRQPGVRALPVALPRWKTPRVMATLRGRTLSPAAVAFKEQVRELCKQMTERSIAQLRD